MLDTHNLNHLISILNVGTFYLRGNFRLYIYTPDIEIRLINLQINKRSRLSINLYT